MARRHHNGEEQSYPTYQHPVRRPSAFLTKRHAIPETRQSSTAIVFCGRLSEKCAQMNFKYKSRENIPSNKTSPSLHNLPQPSSPGPHTATRLPSHIRPKPSSLISLPAFLLVYGCKGGKENSGHSCKPNSPGICRSPSLPPSGSVMSPFRPRPYRAVPIATLRPCAS
ncbi:hypothetical protein ARMGADRAFT_330261 [Armillaria gallica]|uniref:Uncharacterized protein n=1 Tax=Armillaria gallica TaxID=47427 RepID=A0A2H3D6F1_ARMGA|nr:hypothetical protein ARMGADRAFT_330261 [Armillaria gallica]